MKPKTVARAVWVLLTMAVLVVAAPTASDAQPLATCKAMCQRFTDCKMSSYTKKSKLAFKFGFDYHPGIDRMPSERTS